MMMTLLLLRFDGSCGRTLVMWPLLLLVAHVPCKHMRPVQCCMLHAAFQFNQQALGVRCAFAGNGSSTPL